MLRSTQISLKYNTASTTVAALRCILGDLETVPSENEGAVDRASVITSCCQQLHLPAWQLYLTIIFVKISFLGCYLSSRCLESHNLLPSRYPEVDKEGPDSGIKKLLKYIIYYLCIVWSFASKKVWRIGYQSYGLWVPPTDLVAQKSYGTESMG